MTDETGSPKTLQDLMTIHAGGLVNYQDSTHKNLEQDLATLPISLQRDGEGAQR